jgi:hypothetical protein
MFCFIERIYLKTNEKWEENPRRLMEVLSVTVRHLGSIDGGSRTVIQVKGEACEAVLFSDCDTS